MSGSAKKRLLTLRRNAGEINAINTFGKLHDHVTIDSGALTQRYNLKASQLANIHTTEQFIVVRPTTTISASAYSGGNQNNFRFHRDVNLVAKHAQLKLTLTNTGAGAITLPPAPLMINYIEIFANSSKEIQRIYGDQLYEDYIMFADFDHRTASQNVINTNPTTYAFNATLGAGASITYYIPLYSFLDQAHVWMGAFRKELEWRIYLDPQSIVAGLATDVQIDDMELRIDCDRLSEDEVDNQMQLYTKRVDFRYLYYQQMVFSQNINASSTYTLDLQAITGVLPYLTWGLRSSLVGAGKYTWADINGTGGGGTQELLDENNSTLQNGFEEDIDYTRGVLYPKYYQAGWANQRFINVLTHSMDPESAFKSAQNNGYQLYHENKLRFRTGAGWVNGTYNIYFNARQMAVITFMPNGDVMIKRS